MNQINPNDLLNQLQLLAKQAQSSGVIQPSEVNNNDSLNFSEIMKNSVDQVNTQQMKASEISTAFELGDPDVPLSDVMIEMQKARVSFEALKQVRNQLIDAYKEVMNMPL
jgi:flagellar hook-basal body complex protein FliE